MTQDFKTSEKHGNHWKGGRRSGRGGYIFIWSPQHPKAKKTHRGYVEEHILVAEKALGRYLPAGAVVHHIDERRDNNSPSNLVICQNRKYHALLHRRMRAFFACGNATWLKCDRCLKYDAPGNLSHTFGTTRAWHRACNAAFQRKRQNAKKETT